MTVDEIETKIRKLKKDLNYIQDMSNDFLNIIHELEEHIMDLEDIKINEVTYVSLR